MKIIDKLDEYMKAGKPFYSFEFFPPKTKAGLSNLYDRLGRMGSLEPAFIDVTWGAGGSSSELSLEISHTVQNFLGMDVMMHLSCTEQSREDIARVLTRAREQGLRNILAVRGDPVSGKESWEAREDGFRYASDLTAFIRSEFPGCFGVAVGGYPEGHFESPDKKACVTHLKKKVDAGADLIITQLFYDMDEYREFIKLCRETGIQCPIIPGIMPIQNYQRFVRFVDQINIKVPEKIYRQLQAIKDDDAAVMAYGIKQATEMSKQLLEEGAPGLHFYTLNLESSVTGILDELGFLDHCRARRALPWRPSTSIAQDRKREEVRPIFWSNRPLSYLARTSSWDDFPNGRWGLSGSPTFGALDNYYLLRRGMGGEANREKWRRAWGEPQTIEDVADVFCRFCRGEVHKLPWCDVPLQSETRRISEDILDLNRALFLTINSQPAVNAAPSADPDVGWGGEGGLVFQKAYVEFFTSAERWQQLEAVLKGFPSVTYHAVNVHGESFANTDDKSINAVTWGVFPGKEIIQPTVVDPESFIIWKDEAFQLWLDDWRDLYDLDSAAYRLIEQIHNTFFLVNLVENDFVNGDIMAPFRRLKDRRPG